MLRRSQEDRSRETRKVLEQAGRRLFTEHGFAAVSAEEIVAAAGVTRGALNYQYGDKRGLFLAVLDRLEQDNAAEIEAALATAPQPTDLLGTMTLGLGLFLKICQRPEMAQIGLSDAPSVLGWQAWREFEARHGLALITAQLEAAVAGGLVLGARIPVLAQLLLSAVTEAGMMVANAADQDTARAEAEEALLVLIKGILAPAGEPSGAAG
ncbi:TetR/AcrR family transcriptional regulator [Nocardia sp. NPDC052566]|uniref:TetR/AcrR family transcriptional regulator n=1 Tax=Nocardia sp. NPDC052566 TaxID=3364330 RepID=UPI0037C5D01D